MILCGRRDPDSEALIAHHVDSYVRTVDGLLEQRGRVREALEATRVDRGEPARDGPVSAHRLHEDVSAVLRDEAPGRRRIVRHEPGRDPEAELGQEPEMDRPRPVVPAGHQGIDHDAEELRVQEALEHVVRELEAAPRARAGPAAVHHRHDPLVEADVLVAERQIHLGGADPAGRAALLVVRPEPAPGGAEIHDQRRAPGSLAEDPHRVLERRIAQEADAEDGPCHRHDQVSPPWSGVASPFAVAAAAAVVVAAAPPPA